MHNRIVYDPEYREPGESRTMTNAERQARYRQRHGSAHKRRWASYMRQYRQKRKVAAKGNSEAVNHAV